MQSLDFYLPEYNIAIECQGVQHFEPREAFGGEENFKLTQERDLRKKQLCQENGVKLIYFLDKKFTIHMKEDDIYFSKLNELIDYILSQEKITEIVKE